MARPRHCPPVPSPAGFIPGRLILCKLSSSIFRVLLLPRQSLRTVCFLKFTVYFCSLLQNHSMYEAIKMFRVVRIVRRPFGVPMDWPHAKCSLCDIFLYIVAAPQLFITQCLECFPPKECIPERFQDVLQAYYSDHNPLSEPSAAARPLDDVLESGDDKTLHVCSRADHCGSRAQTRLSRIS